MVIIGGLGSVLGSIFGALFVTPPPIATRWLLDGFGGLFLSQANLDEVVPQLRLVIFGGLIIFFLIVEPDRLGAASAEHPHLLPLMAVFRSTEVRR